MGWTLKHSQNAVAAKARKRMAEPDYSREPHRKVRMPRGRVRFTLTLEDHEIGDKMRLQPVLIAMARAVRFNGWPATLAAQKSVRL